MRIRRTGLISLFVAALAVVALVAGGCGSSSSKTTAATTATSSTGSGTTASSTPSATSTSACSGSAVTVMLIQNLTGPSQLMTDVPNTANAAAKAVNAECQLGRPLKLEVCDDQLSPNADEACARKAVSDHVLAVIDDGLLGADTTPILAAARIVDFTTLDISAAQLNSPYVFSVGPAVASTIGVVNEVLSAGAKKIDIVTYNVPGDQALFALATPLIKSLGGAAPTFTLVPANATDMTQYTAQALANGATGLVLGLGAQQIEGVLKNLEEQGLTLTKLHVSAGTDAVDQSFLAAAGSSANGLLAAGWAWPEGDLSNSGIAKMYAELRSGGESTNGLDDFGVSAWTAVHEIGDLLQGSTVNGATLKAKLMTASINQPQLVPIDFSKPAFAGNSLFGSSLGKFLTLTSTYTAYSEVKNGKLVPITKTFSSVLQKTNLSGS